MIATAGCPQKFFLEYVLKLSIMGISPDLHAGGAFADAIHHTRVALYRDNLPLSEALAVGTYKFAQFWGDYEPPENHPKDFVTTINALYAYFVEYPPATDEVQPYRKADGAPAVEFSFALPTRVPHPETGNPIIYGGRADMIGKRGSLLVIVDEKTTKAISPSTMKAWRMRGQFLGYCKAAQEHGFDINTACVRNVALQKTQYKFLEIFEQYPQWQIDLWWEETQRKIEFLAGLYAGIKERIREYREGADVGVLFPAYRMFPYSFGDLCTQFGGCGMMSQCTNSEPWNWLDDFAVRLWNPLDKDPTAKSPEMPEHTVSWEEAWA